MNTEDSTPGYPNADNQFKRVIQRMLLHWKAKRQVRTMERLIRREVAELKALDDRALRDIGLNRDSIRYDVRNRAIADQARQIVRQSSCRRVADDIKLLRSD